MAGHLHCCEPQDMMVTMAMTYHGLTYHGLIYPPPGRGREAAGLANAGATVAPRCFGKNLKIMRLA